MGELIRKLYRDKNGELKTAAKWYADFVDANGIRRKKPLARNKESALVLLAELVKKVDRAKAGLTDKFEDWRKVPMAKHLADWKRSLEAQGLADGGELTTRRAERLVVDAKVVFLGDLIPSVLVEALTRLAKADGLSAQTYNHYLGALKQLVRWLERDGRIEANPLRHLKGKGLKSNLVHERRVYTIDELNWLYRETQSGKTVVGVSGGDRVWLYKLAVVTALRAKELWSLTPQSFCGGFVTIQAGDAKNRKEDALPIPKALSEALMDWVATKPKGKQIFGAFGRPLKSGRVDTSLFSKALKRDMLRARQAWLADGGDPESDFLLWEDSQGRFLDFHSKRATGITMLAEAGANPKTVQAFARHSTITLTMDRYCKAPKGFDLVGVSNGLGEKLFGQPAPGGDWARATPPPNGPVMDPKLTPKGAIQKTRLISIDTAGQKGVPLETTRKQAFGGVFPRKQAMPAAGIEPATDGLENRCSIH